MTKGTVFYKMTGSGNDFVALDGRYTGLSEVTPEAVRALCDRRNGIGADGVMLLVPDGPSEAHFTFHFWNSDGSPGPMCGNGALCATSLAPILELAPRNEEVRFATPSGLHRGRVVEGRPEIRLPDCGPPKPLPDARAAAGERCVCLVTPSVPHMVLVVDDVAGVDLEERGPTLRHDPSLGPGGANVNWVSVGSDGTIRMRTYERGVEAETFACGTGAVACALVLADQGLASAPTRIWTATDMPLDVSWLSVAGRVTDVLLRGEGRLVYRGVVGTLLSS